MTSPRLPSKRSSSFKRLYAQMPQAIQNEADEAYQRFRADPDYPGLHFKQIVGRYYSARIGSGHRALAVRQTGHWLWFWIGTHANYDRVLDRLRSGQQRP